MDLTSTWFAVALVFITIVLVGILRGKTVVVVPTSGTEPPPVVNWFSLLRLAPRLLNMDLPTKMDYLYNMFGSVFTISIFGRSLTFLIGPGVASHFYQGSEADVSHGDLLEFTVPMFGQEVAHGVDIPTRMEQTRFFLDALRPAKLKNHFDPMLREVEGYFRKWGQQGIVDLKHEFEQLLMLIASRCLLGKEVREQLLDEFFTLFHQIESGVNMISVFFPYVPIPAHIRRDRARRKLTELVSKIVRSRTSSGSVEEDTLQKLIDSKYKDGRSTTETEVVGMIIALIFGGKHTSSSTSSWTGACLLSHEKFLTAAVEEQKQIIMKCKGKLDYSALSEMNILHSCIKEALRMHPVAPMLVRRAHKHFTVRTREGNEYEIPKGHTIASPMVLNNHLPYIYKDPHLYDPERFGALRQEDVVGGKYSYTSFGGGRHVCLGEAYAYMQIKVIWSYLLQNFELKLLSPFPKTDWNKIVAEPQGNMMVSYKRQCLLN